MYSNILTAAKDQDVSFKAIILPTTDHKILMKLSDNIDSFAFLLKISTLFPFH